MSDLQTAFASARTLGSRVIEGVVYFTQDDVITVFGITRQTLWRWRKHRLVPQGRRLRNRELLFTREEFLQMARYANKLELVEERDPNQLTLFSSA